jgi:hypothetical protein
MDLRITDTNAADDSRGRVFGLDGDLYLPVIVAAVLSMAMFAVIGLVLRAGWVLAGAVSAVPSAVTLGWAAFLRNGKPPAHDRDAIAQWLGGGDFGRQPAAQGGLTEA